MSVRVVINDLQPAADQVDYRVHCDALEWILAEPIIINSAEDIRSRVDWQTRLEPYYHQVQNLMRFCRRLPVTLLADDVGLGKTISAGLIISELMKRSRISKVFVICPKILIPQWIEELDAKFGIEAYGATGAELHSSSRRAEPVIVTTYQSATRFLNTQESGLFDMLILDEAHKVRNLHGTPSPPKLATAIYGALEARMFKYVLMLTATPIQNRLWDIYSLVDCLAAAKGHRNPFGSPENFAMRYLADGKGKARKLNPHRADEFRTIVGSYMFRTRRVDAKLAFPDRKVKLYPVRPSEDELVIQQVIADNIHRFNALLQSSLLVALMSSPNALAAQLKNMAAKKGEYKSLAAEIGRIVARSQTPAKTSVVLRIVADLKKQRSDWRIVIFTTRKETQRMIARVLEKSGVSVGFITGGEPVRNRQSIEAFCQTTPEINVLISTDAGAEGVNLQAANIMVNYDLPWNPMIVEQRIGRVQIIGSKFKSVWVANVVHENSPEQKIVARLMEKLQVISHTVGDIEAVLDVSGDSNVDSFEKQIREMVIASLQGQDVAAAARKAEQSIEDARNLFESQQVEMDATLGSMNDEESADVPMPRLAKCEPNTSLQEFVLNALKAEGASVKDEGRGVFRATSARLQEERFTFEQDVWEEHSRQGVFMGRAPLLYQPGKPAFERLVQRWIDRSAARIQDHRSNEADFAVIAKSWLTNVPEASLCSAELSERVNEFKGSLVCRTRVSNAIDSYENLLRISCKTNRGLSDADIRVNHAVNAGLLAPQMERDITAAVDKDADLAKFRRYYEERLRVELDNAQPGSRREKLVNDLRPTVTSEASAVEGRLTDIVTLAIKYQFDGSPQYESKVEFQGNKVVSEPNRATCQVTGLDLPIDCLGKCEVSGAVALRHELESSEHSGKFGLPNMLGTCEQTGKRALTSELDECCVTKQRVLKDKLVKSEMTRRLAVVAHATRCEITGTLLLDDEVTTSGHSKKRFRSDEAATIQPSGLVVHRSEATQCTFSGKWHLSDDCAPSDASGMPAFIEDLRKSEKSGRRCHKSEIQVCAQSGKELLPDEVARCDMTGQVVDNDLLTICPDTLTRGLKTQFAKCEVTGELVSPEALGRCAVTNVKARKTLLAPSDVSGRLALAEKLVICEVSGAKQLPNEAEHCAISGKLVSVQLLKQCSKSGTLALANEMVQSTVSDKWMLREYATKLRDGTYAGRDEATLCNWDLSFLPANEIANCTLSGLTFTRRYMNPSGEFVTLRQCLEGGHPGRAFPDPDFLARLWPDVFGGVKSFQWVSSANGQSHILFGSKTLFRLLHSWFAVMAHGDLNGITLRGKVLFGKRSKRIWTMTESHETAK